MSNIPTAIEVLKENVDPKIAAIKPDELIPKDLVINEFDDEAFTGPMHTPEAGYISVYGLISSGNTRFGDTWGYRSGDYRLESARLKTKKGTAMIEFTEDHISRVRSNDAFFIKNAIEMQMKMESRKLAISMEKMAFPLTIGDPEYDRDWVSPLAPSSVGTVANPADCNSTPGTPEDLTAVKLSGTAQTMRNVEAITSKIETLIATNISNDTNFMMDWSEKVLLVPPIVYALLNTTADMKTNVKIADMKYLQEFEASGYKVIQSRYVDPNYTALSAGTPCKICVVGSPKKNFIKAIVPSDEGLGWTDWQKWMNKDNGISKIYYEKHKKFEWFMMARAYSIRKNDDTHTWKKPVIWLTITPNAAE